MNDARLNKQDCEKVRRGQCPDCQGGQLLSGPSGGLSQNFICNKSGCTFNDLGPFGVERIPQPQAPNEYIYTMWFVSTDNLDLMTVLYRPTKESDELAIRYRFRYHNPESKNPFDGKDRKSHWSADASGKTVEECRTMLTQMAEMIAIHMKADICDRFNVDGTADKLAELAIARKLPPWMHIEMVEVNRA